MDIGTELRRLTFSSPDGVHERRHGAHRLTAQAIEDAPDGIGFTLSEAGARGWTPVVAGRISGTGELTLTYCSTQTSEAGLALLFAWLGREALPDNVTPLPETAATSTRSVLPDLDLAG